jgi:hypothetical protein
MSARMCGGIMGIGLAALVAVFLWRTLRSDEASSGAAVQPAHAADLTAPSAPSSTPATPATSRAPAIAPRAAAFVDEPRDARWASATERTLRERFRTVRGARLSDTECRTRQCRLVVIGSRDQIGHTIAELGGAHGLHGLAIALELAPPESHADGSVTLRAYAQFSR